MSARGHELVLRHEDSGHRHYLDGKAVHAGTTLELELQDGSWLRGGYEWSFHPAQTPILTFRIAVTGQPVDPELGQDGTLTARVALGWKCRLRWPERVGLELKPAPVLGQVVEKRR